MSRRSIAFTLGFLVLIGAAIALLWGERDTADRVAPAQTAENALVQPHSPVVGRMDAAVTIVEFFDPACEGCATFHPIVKSVLEEFPNEVRVVYRYLPFHKGSDQVVGILEAARHQGKFETTLDALLSRQSEWASHGRQNVDAAWSIAAAGGLDLASARVTAASAETKRVIEQDFAAGGTHRIRQTPTIFVGGETLASYNREELRQRVLRELEKTRSPPSAPTAP